MVLGVSICFQIFLFQIGNRCGRYSFTFTIHLLTYFSTDEIDSTFSFIETTMFLLAILLLVLFSIIAQVHAQACSGICSGGESPPKPDATIFGVSTCSDYDTLLKFITNQTDCDQGQVLGGIYCGCSGFNPLCHGICSNGQLPSKPDTVVFDEFTCGEYNSLIQSVITEKDCTDGQAIGSLCGCSDAVPASSALGLSYKGTAGAISVLFCSFVFSRMF